MTKASTFMDRPCPVFVQEFFLNRHKYSGLADKVDAHIAECPICARKMERLEEEAREWEEDDKPGFRH